MWGYDPTQKPKTGTVEEWYTSRYQWRRTYSSSEQEYSGWELSLSRFERYRSKSRGGFNPTTMNDRVGRPAIDPLYLAGNIKPDYELDGKRFSPAGTVLLSIVDDDASVREALKDLIRAMGFSVETFASAEDFLSSGNLSKTDFLITDMRMPQECPGWSCTSVCVPWARRCRWY